MKPIPIKDMSRERLEIEYLNLLAVTKIKDDQLTDKDREIEKAKRLLVDILCHYKTTCYPLPKEFRERIKSFLGGTERTVKYDPQTILC